MTIEEIKSAITRLRQNQHEIELQCLFFYFFAQFEYAMKQSEYLKAKNDTDDTAEADWGKLANSQTVRDLVTNAVNEQGGNQYLKEAILYLRDTPPKKQIVSTSGRLDWRDVNQTEPLPLRLTLYIRRVRNNLFHGGKARNAGESIERNKKLLEHALIVLYEFSKCDQSLNRVIWRETR
jgi:hypothetical protein